MVIRPHRKASIEIYPRASASVEGGEVTAESATAGIGEGGQLTLVLGYDVGRGRGREGMHSTSFTHKGGGRGGSRAAAAALLGSLPNFAALKQMAALYFVNV